MRRRFAIRIGLAIVTNAGFFEPRFDLTIINDCRITPRTHTEAKITLGDQLFDNGDVVEKIFASQRTQAQKLLRNGVIVIGEQEDPGLSLGYVVLCQGDQGVL